MSKGHKRRANSGTARSNGCRCTRWPPPTGFFIARAIDGDSVNLVAALFEPHARVLVDAVERDPAAG
jgi:hypothetical protein